MTLRRLAGDTLVYGTGYILGKVLNYLLITVYLTWKFDGETEQYGLYTDFYFYVALVLVVLTLRMETTYFRYGSDKAMKERVFNQALLLLMITSAAWLLFVFGARQGIASFLQYPDLTAHVVILGVVIALDILVAIPFASLRLQNRPVRFAFLKLSGILVNILFVLVFLELLPYLIERGVGWATELYADEHRLLYVFLANLLGSLFVFLAFLPQFTRVKFRWDQQLTRQLLRYTWPLILVGVAGVINQSSYITFQKFILPNSLTENLAIGGVYAAATRIALLMSLFTTAFNYAAEPFFFQQKQVSDDRKVYADVATAFTIASTVIMLGILLYLDLVQFMLGTSFRSALYVVPTLLLAFFMLGLYYNFSIWYKLSDKTIYGAIISLGGALITILANIFLIPLIGIEGSAFASLACYAFMTLTCYMLGKRHYPIPYNIPRIFLLLLIAGAAYGFSELLRSVFTPNLIVLIMMNTMILVIYLLVVFRIEKRAILEIVRRN